MFVKQLIGRMAGTVVEMPFAAATSNIASGTCVLATEDEIAAAGLEPVPVADLAKPELLPTGYRTEVTEAGGYDLLDPGGVRLNQEPFANMPAVLSFAHEHLTATAPLAVYIPLSQVPPAEAPTFTLDDYRFEAVEGGGFRLFDPAGAAIGEDPYADEDAARLAARENYAAARGLSLDDLAAEEAGRGLLAEVAVPDGWKSLHHTQRRALASRIAGRPIAATAEADEVIEEYVTRPAA